MTSDDSVTDATHPAVPDRVRRSEGADTVPGAHMINNYLVAATVEGGAQ